MTEKEHTIEMQHNYIIGAKRRIIKFKNLLTTEDIIDIINELVTFKNVHLIANSFKDKQVAQALKEELKVTLNK